MGQPHEMGIRMEQMMPLIREQLSSGNRVIFQPKGTSMLPMLRQDVDRVVLSPISRPLRKYDLPLYQRTNGQYVLHRIVDIGGEIACMGDNQFEKETGLKPEQMIGIVSSFYRDGREYQTGDLCYQAYCHFWDKTRWIRRRLIKLKALLRRYMK